ncbi:hypothetical protein ACQ86C_06585 [Enterobacter asburiae]|jgi:hypothetical protein|uniref:hypothetical protein n=1 Tax=Enterobacter asburiae TaxID=61645 RepID=UPI0019380ED5|nr:hypothetical protein [Enterobacter asburiae]QQE37202.1 hypothetical protein I6I13_12285 [Enterobacter asburiae]
MKKIIFLILSVYASTSVADVRCQRPIILNLNTGVSEFINGDATNNTTNALAMAMNLGWRIVYPATIYGASTANNSDGKVKGLLIVEKDFPTQAECALSRPIR